MMPPGPVPGALASQAVEGLASLPDDKLTSVILAARRLQARDEYLELAAVAEFARRRDQQYEASKARGDKPRHREGEFAAAAPGMAPAGLKQKAARLEMRLDPDGVRQRKEEAARKHRRVEARQEASGNASLAGRELAVVDALAAKNAVWAEAAALCNAGLDVSLREARTIVYLMGIWQAPLIVYWVVEPLVQIAGLPVRSMPSGAGCWMPVHRPAGSDWCGRYREPVS